jgi:hypothetical protein
MDDDPASKGESAPEHVTFERIDGELDAAIVFAVAAKHQYQNGNPEFGAACLSDAMDGYTRVLGALSKGNLTGARLQDVEAKLIALRELLDGLRTGKINEAA